MLGGLLTLDKVCASIFDIIFNPCGLREICCMGQEGL
jgi:hypothetical protein